MASRNVSATPRSSRSLFLGEWKTSSRLAWVMKSDWIKNYMYVISVVDHRRLFGETPLEDKEDLTENWLSKYIRRSIHIP